MKELLLILVLISSNCNGQSSEKKLIKKFVSEIILNDDFSFTESKKFINYGELTEEQEKNIEPLIKENVRLIKKELNGTSDYEVFSDKELSNNSIDANFIYEKNNDRVFHLVKNNHVITSFILRENKLISFCYNIRKNVNRPKTPLILNRI